MILESNMRIGMPPISGQESFWGDVKPTNKEVELINASPTLQSQLRDYGADVNSGEMNPMALVSKGSYFDGKGAKGISFSKDVDSWSTNMMVGTLAHEIGHYKNLAKDNAFESRYDINPRDPNAYYVTALRGLHQEGEAAANNWLVQQEIEKNTARPNAPGTRIYLAGTDKLPKTLDKQHAADVQDGKSDIVHRNHLTVAGMSDFAANHPSHNPDDTYFRYFGGESGAPAPVPGSPKEVAFVGDDKGDINQMAESWKSGEHARQTFSEGKIQSSKLLDGSGKVASESVYKYNDDGSYLVDVKNGDGDETKHAEFKADRSGTVRDYKSDGSTRAISFNADDLDTQILDYNAKGQKSLAQYLDADSGQSTVQVVRARDGGHTVFNFGTTGRVRSLFEYDRNGNPKRSADFDEKGGNTYVVNYGADSSRTAVKFNADGSQTDHLVDRNGNRGPDYTFPTPEAKSTKEGTATV